MYMLPVINAVTHLDQNKVAHSSQVIYSNTI